MRRSVISLLFIVLLTSCGSSKSGLTSDDLAIEKLDNNKEVVQYGMSRANVEKVLGEGSKSVINVIDYKDGVSILYRDNAVVLIALSEESSGVFSTTQGAEINMNKGDLKKIYGHDHAIETSEKNLDYIYDSTNKKYLSELSVKSEDRTKIYNISATFNDIGEVERIFMMDNNAATQMK